ncbi:DnaA N-terminal domain-containing protein [Thalassospira alkalitolerans]|uniref:DnaA N-terminal domain-containing protein n=1 Tax=Thalassospira alkalitolerans TaxID=1293890 RepID=UPI003AA8C6A9
MSEDTDLRVAKAVGQNASARKYDILTVLATYALSQDKHLQRRVLRLMSLITARYNWQRDELCVGQAEIAKMWSVDQRTVKREMAKFRALGWLVEKRAGVRGRVAVYGLDVAVIMADTKATWENVGPDLVERLTPSAAPQDSGNVVAFKKGLTPAFGSDVWGKAQAELYRISPHIVDNWLKDAKVIEEGQGALTLMVPSKFFKDYIEKNLIQRIEGVVRRIDPTIGRIRVEF